MSRYCRNRLPTRTSTFGNDVWTETPTLVAQYARFGACIRSLQETNWTVAGISQAALRRLCGSTRRCKTVAELVHFLKRSKIVFARKCVFFRIRGGQKYLKAPPAIEVTARDPRSACIKGFVQFQCSKKSTF